MTTTNDDFISKIETSFELVDDHPWSDGKIYHSYLLFLASRLDPWTCWYLAIIESRVLKYIYEPKQIYVMMCAIKIYEICQQKYCFKSYDWLKKYLYTWNIINVISVWTMEYLSVNYAKIINIFCCILILCFTYFIFNITYIKCKRNQYIKCNKLLWKYVNYR